MNEERPYSAESLIVGPQTYRYYPVSQVEGSKSLPYSLTVLLENVLRCARSAEEARVLADRVVSARLSSRRPAFCSKTSRVFPCSSISRSCARHALT